jgi:Protein of unknown function (DUF3795)
MLKKHERRAMAGQKDFTAYCGLYCRDCIPSDAPLFQMVRELIELSSKLHLDRYAELKARTNDSFSDYPVFERVLSAIVALQCPGPCRHGGGKTDCPIRECARERHYEGCWECPERGECELLAPLKKFHGVTINRNLDAIEEHGPDDWADKRGPHYPWSET